MSDGLKLISAAVRENSPAILMRTSREQFIDNEAVVLDFVLSHLAEYRELPSAAIVQERTGVRLPTTTDAVQVFADRLNERYMHGRALEHFPAMRGALQARNMTDFWNVYDALAPIRRGVQGDRSMHMGEAMGSYLERRRHHRNGLIEAVPIGWPELDASLGGYEPTDLVTWVARPGIAKTWLLLYQAWRAHAMGHNVAFFTTEMGVSDIAGRYYALDEGRDMRSTRNRELTTHEERRMAEFMGRAGLDRFRVVPAGLEPSVGTVQSIIEEIRPSAVYIDGVYFLRPREINKYRSAAETMSKVVHELKGLTQTYSTPIIVTNQYNRQAGKGGKQGSLENIGGSDAFSQDSDIIVQVGDGPNADSRTISLKKARRGFLGEDEWEINFKFAPTNFNVMSADEAMEATTTTARNALWTTRRGED